MKYKSGISKTNIGLYLVFLPLFFLSIINPLYDRALFIFSLLIIFLILKKTYNSPVFFLSVFQLIFYIPFFYFYFFNWQISIYPSFNNISNTRETGHIFQLFQFAYFCNLKKLTAYKPILNKLFFIKNNFIFFILLSFSTFLLITSLSGETIFTARYGSQVKIGSTLYEYIIPLILIAFLYSGRSRNNIITLGIFIVVYIIKDLLFGGRVSSIQIMLLSYILFFDQKYSFKNIIITVVIAVIFFKSFEIIRLSSELIENPLAFEFKSLLVSSSENNVYGSNEGDVIHSSTRLIGMINSNVITLKDRIDSFFLFLLSIINPGLDLPKLANLTSYLQNKYPCGGGGLFPVYFFVWWGYAGVALSGLFVSSIINFLVKSEKVIPLLYTIMLLTTFPRWYAYNPITMFKISALPIILYIIINQLKLSKRINNI